MKRVAVVRGGPSDEHHVSLETGTTVIEALDRLRYPVKDVLVSRRGEWLDGGIVRPPEQFFEAIDVVFIALHGTYGEDGSLQRLLKRLHVPFTGSSAFPSAVALNKDLTKNQLKQHGVLSPKHLKLTRAGTTDPYRTAQSIISLFGPEYVIKPVASGSSLGTVVVHEEAALAFAITNALTAHESIMVEERIVGREATVGVVEGFRGSRLYRFPPIEIVPPEYADFFDFDAKYSGTTREICPGQFSDTEKEALLDTAAHVHELLGLTQYSRSDFMVRNGHVYFLEVNTLPGLTSGSLFPKAVAAVGARYDDLIEHLVETAIAN